MVFIAVSRGQFYYTFSSQMPFPLRGRSGYLPYTLRVLRGHDVVGAMENFRRACDGFDVG